MGFSFLPRSSLEVGQSQCDDEYCDVLGGESCPTPGRKIETVAPCYGSQFDMFEAPHDLSWTTGNKLLNYKEDQYEPVSNKQGKNDTANPGKNDLKRM